MRIATAWLIGLSLGGAGCGSEAPAASPTSSPPATTPVATATAPVSEPAPPEHADWLSDDYAKVLPRRARVAHYGEARLRSDVEPETKKYRAQGSYWEKGTVVVAEVLPETEGGDLGLSPNPAPKQVRVVFETPRLRALVWLSASQLYRTPTRRVRLGPGTDTLPPARLADDAEGVLPRGVTLNPGARLSLSGVHEGRTYLRAGGRIPVGATLNIIGWVGRGTPLGVTFPAESAEPSQLPKKGRVWALEDSVDILAKPGGALIASFKRLYHKGVMAVRVTEVRPGPGRMREIVYQGEGIEIRGFIARNKLSRPKRSSGAGPGEGRSGAVEEGPTERIEVPPGTCLYDARNGLAIGVTRVAFQRAVTVPKTEQGWRQLQITGDFSFKAWLRLSDVKTGQLGELKKGTPIRLEAGKWNCPAQTK